MAKTKRILLIIESLSFGGCEKTLVEVANRLCDKGYDLSVCSLFRKSVYREYPFEINPRLRDGVHFNYLSDNTVVWKYRLFCFLLYRFPRTLFQLLVGDHYDRVVAFCEGAPTPFVAKANIKKGKRIAWLHTMASLSQKGKGTEALAEEKQLYSSFSKIVAVSKGVAESFALLFPEIEDKLAVAYNPINISDIREMADGAADCVKPKETLLVSVGRITWAKGYERYLRAVKELRALGFVFSVWIIGGGNRDSLEEYCRSAGLDNVRFLGNKTNPYPYMCMADWIVVPSYVEGLSTVLIEGLALGKATLSTDCGGNREIVGNNESGLLVKNDEPALLSGLIQVLTDPDLRIRFENSAEQRLSSFYPESCIETIERLLND